MLKEIIYKYHIGNIRNYKFLSVNYASPWCPDRPYVMCASPVIQIRVTQTQAHAAPCGEDSGCAAPVKPPTGTDLGARLLDFQSLGQCQFQVS